MSANKPDPFSPLAVGSLNRRNGVAMAPLTDRRAGPGNVPHVLNAPFYAQLASTTLAVANRERFYGGGEEEYTDCQVLRSAEPDVCYQDLERAWG
jgi:2,4-dienoyl-CoA reductase-like NADH-dependent reductase (Old Yellow Enzyme family)